MSTPKANGDAGAGHELRRDIQALRGVAVLVVVLYHYSLGGLERGYLGVDVFFVISGYLISRQILLLRQAGRFSLRDFYLRRARRLLPALYAMLGALAAWMLAFASESEWQAFSSQIHGAVGYYANVVFWLEGGYFGGDARLKPLLHLWSLAVEEQFYLLLPVLLIVLRPRWWLPVLALLAFASLGACLWLVGPAPEASFFLLPTRAWELLAGALLAAATLPGREPIAVVLTGVARWLAWPALLAAAAAVAFGHGRSHPGLDAGVVVSATVILIAARPGWLERGPLVAALARCGDISYSLYLVHWPLHALALSANLTRPLGWHASVGLLLLALLLAVLSYRFIEQPLRRPLADNRRFLGGIMITSLLLLALPWSRPRPPADEIDWPRVRAGVVGFDWRCDFSSTYDDPPECRNADRPRILVWGDSTAMHWVPGLAASGFEFRQATKSVCAPVLGIAPVLANYGEIWGNRCIAFNDSVMRHLERPDRSEQLVLLASTFTGFASQVFDGQRTLDADQDRVVAAFVATISRLREAGIAVAILAPLPSPGVDLGACLEKAAYGRHAADDLLASDCSFELDVSRERGAAALGLLGAIRRETAIEIVRPSDVLCSAGRCVASLDGVPLYRDALHLTRPGSEILVRRLRARLQALAERP